MTILLQKAQYHKLLPEYKKLLEKHSPAAPVLPPMNTPWSGNTGNFWVPQPSHTTQVAQRVPDLEPSQIQPTRFDQLCENVSHLMHRVEGMNQTNARSVFIPPPTWVKRRTSLWDPKEYLQKSGIASYEPYRDLAISPLAVLHQNH